MIKQFAFALSVSTICANIHPAYALPRSEILDSDYKGGIKVKRIIHPEKDLERPRMRTPQRMRYNKDRIVRPLSRIALKERPKVRVERAPRVNLKEGLNTKTSREIARFVRKERPMVRARQVSRVDLKERLNTRIARTIPRLDRKERQNVSIVRQATRIDLRERPNIKAARRKQEILEPRITIPILSGRAATPLPLEPVKMAPIQAASRSFIVAPTVIPEVVKAPPVIAIALPKPEVTLAPEVVSLNNSLPLSAPPVHSEPNLGLSQELPAPEIVNVVQHNDALVDSSKSMEQKSPPMDMQRQALKTENSNLGDNLTNDLPLVTQPEFAEGGEGQWQRLDVAGKLPEDPVVNTDLRKAENPSSMEQQVFSLLPDGQGEESTREEEVSPLVQSAQRTEDFFHAQAETIQSALGFIEDGIDKAQELLQESKSAFAEAVVDHMPEILSQPFLAPEPNTVPSQISDAISEENIFNGIENIKENLVRVSDSLQDVFSQIVNSREEVNLDTEISLDQAVAFIPIVEESQAVMNIREGEKYNIEDTQNNREAKERRVAEARVAREGENNRLELLRAEMVRQVKIHQQENLRQEVQPEAIVPVEENASKVPVQEIEQPAAVAVIPGNPDEEAKPAELAQEIPVQEVQQPAADKVTPGNPDEEAKPAEVVQEIPVQEIAQPAADKVTPGNPDEEAKPAEVVQEIPVQEIAQPAADKVTPGNPDEEAKPAEVAQEVPVQEVQQLAADKVTPGNPEEKAQPAEVAQDIPVQEVQQLAADKVTPGNPEEKAQPAEVAQDIPVQEVPQPAAVAVTPGNPDEDAKPVKVVQEIPVEEIQQPAADKVTPGNPDEEAKPAEVAQDIPVQEVPQPAAVAVTPGNPDEDAKPVKVVQEIPVEEVQQPAADKVTPGNPDEEAKPAEVVQEIPVEEVQQPAADKVTPGNPDEEAKPAEVVQEIPVQEIAQPAADKVTPGNPEEKAQPAEVAQEIPVQEVPQPAAVAVTPGNPDEKAQPVEVAPLDVYSLEPSLANISSTLQALENSINKIIEESYNGNFPHYFYVKGSKKIEDQKHIVTNIFNISEVIRKKLSSMGSVLAGSDKLEEEKVMATKQKIEALGTTLEKVQSNLGLIQSTIGSLGSTTESVNAAADQGDKQKEENQPLATTSVEKPIMFQGKPMSYVVNANEQQKDPHKPFNVTINVPVEPLQNPLHLTNDSTASEKESKNKQLEQSDLDASMSNSSLINALGSTRLDQILAEDEGLGQADTALSSHRDDSTIVLSDNDESEVMDSRLSMSISQALEDLIPSLDAVLAVKDQPERFKSEIDTVTLRDYSNVLRGELENLVGSNYSPASDDFVIEVTALKKTILTVLPSIKEKITEDHNSVLVFAKSVKGFADYALK